LKPHQLESKLKALRLGGMLDTLEVRLRDAEQGKLGYLEFLELLLEDEINRRSQKAFSVRILRAHFEEHQTLAQFDFNFNPKVPAAMVRDLATCRFVEHHESVIICGPVGVGKSHIAQALGHVACQHEYDVRYLLTNQLLRDLGGGHADGTWETRLRRYLQPDLLILDDFGARDFSPMQSEDVYELIRERDRHGSMIVVSNRFPPEWYPLFANPVLAEGALDRLINSSHHVIIDGPSYRPLRRPGQQAPGAKGGCWRRTAMWPMMRNDSQDAGVCILAQYRPVRS